MSFINGILTGLLEAALHPLRELHPLVGLTLMAMLTAALVLLAYKYASNQQAVARTKRKLYAHLFEVRLFGDDPRTILHAQLGILRHSIAYLKLSLPPMAWLAAPLLLLTTQMQSHYGYRVPQPGQTFVVQAQINEAAASVLAGRRPSASLHSNDPGLQVQTATVWIPTQRRIAWRIALHSPGDYRLTLSYEGLTLEKSFDARPAIVSRSPHRPGSNLLDQLLYPTEPPLPADSPLHSIDIQLQDAQLTIPILGWSWHWTTAFLLLTLVFVLALRNSFGVRI
ncbi:MAG: hypothetical protein KDI68_09630 [Gammaproteobacteria bacterium]|nr:hypothetical protein [Gammaproteobacteria bacterium]